MTLADALAQLAAAVDIAHLRGGAATAWGLACLVLLPAAVRALIWRDRPGDAWKATTFFCGILFCAFPSRSMARPADYVAREWLFVLSILLALYVLVLEYRDWRQRRG